MPKKEKTAGLHEAVITGTIEQLEAAAALTGRPLQHLVSAPNGAFATDAHGPGLLKLLSKTLGQDHRHKPEWDALERAEKTALLRKAAGIPSFTQTGLVPRQNMREFAAEMPETVDRLYPEYRVDSLQCQLGMLEGCDTTGQVEAHIPEADLYACLKCLSKDQDETQQTLRRWMKSPAKPWPWIHPADRIGHLCPERGPVTNH